MALKKGDFVRINYTGKIKETGEVFDTTYAEVAKKHGFYDPKMVFKAQPIVIGARHVMPGIDNGIIGTEVGEKTVIEVAPKDGYGVRDPSKVQLLPLKEFKKKGINPVPGMHIEVGDSVGRIQSVGGGRVRVDLNHGLAGKVLEYEVNVEERTNKKEERIRQLLELYIPFADPHSHTIISKDKTVEIVIPDSVKLNPALNNGKFSTVRDVFAFIDDVDEVVFQEIYKKMPSDVKKAKVAKKSPAKRKAKPSSK